MTEQKKLTKAQREFFDRITREILTGVCTFVIDDPEEVEVEVKQADIDSLTTLVGNAYLSRIDFTTLKRVDRATRSDEFKAVHAAALEVGEEIQGVLVSAVENMLQRRAEGEAKA